MSPTHLENPPKMGSFLQEMDTVISELEQSFTQLQNKQERIMQNQNTVQTKSLYAEKPCEAANFSKKAFADYIAKGDINYESKNYLLSRDDNSGGYLIPGFIRDQIDEKLKNLCPLRSLAKVNTIQSDSLELLIDKGTAEAGWMISDELEENTMPELTKMRIATYPLYAKPKASQKILDDAGDRLEEWLVMKITQKISSLENQAFLYGDGDHKPKGLLQYPLVSIGQGEWGKIECVHLQTEHAEITRESLLEIASSLKAEYLPQAVWLMSRSALMSIQNIKDDLGRFLWQPSLTIGMPSCLLGYPLIVSDDMPQISQNEVTTPILFGNFSEAYQIVDKGNMSILRDPYSAKPYVEFYATKRVGGDVVNFEAIKALCLKPIIPA